MRKLHITGNLLKVLMLGALLTSCNNDDIMAPQETAGVTLDDQNGKINAELKLVKDGLNTLQYIKSGRLTGKLSKVTGEYYRTEYSYDDSSDNLWITAKTYHKATNALTKEMKYKVARGRCVTSIDLTTNWTCEYIFNELGILLEKNLSKGPLTQKEVFNYYYSAPSGTYRLSNIVKSTPVGNFEQIDFYYTDGYQSEKVAKYYLNPEHTGLDMYLPYFGKVSDVLVRKVEIKPLPYTNQTKPFYRYYYGMNNDGYATSRERVFFPLGWGYEAGKQSYYSAFDYSTNWQGI